MIKQTSPVFMRVHEHAYICIYRIYMVYTQMKSLVEMENSGLLVLLAQDKYDDLARMYALFR